MKNLTVEFYISSTVRSLINWSKGVVEINKGTFKFDGSMPESCTIAMYNSKVGIQIEALDYLYSLDNQEMTTAQLTEYRRIRNQ